MKRIPTRRAAILTTALALTLGGCTPAAHATETSLVVWTDEGKLDAVTAVANAFGEAHDIHVAVQAIPDLRASFLSANEAGNGPDVLVGAHDWIGQLVANGAIEPLALSEDNLAEYSPMAVDAVTSGGLVYGVPYGVEAAVMYCNPAIVGNQRFATLDDAIAAGKAAQQQGKVDVSVAVGVDTTNGSYNLQALYTSAGGYIFGTTKSGATNVDDLGIDSPGGLAAAEEIHQLGEAGEKVLSTSVTSDNAASLFASGRAACLISGPWSLDDVRKGLGDGFFVQPIPALAGKNVARPFMGAQAFYVATGAKNRTYAEEFVTGTRAGDVNTPTAMTTMYQVTHLVPAMLSVRAAAVADDPLIGQFASAADQGEPMPSVPEMDQVFTPLAQAYVSIVGGADPDTTMRKAAKSVRDAIGAN